MNPPSNSNVFSARKVLSLKKFLAQGHGIKKKVCWNLMGIFPVKRNILCSTTFIPSTWDNGRDYMAKSVGDCCSSSVVADGVKNYRGKYHKIVVNEKCGKESWGDAASSSTLLNSIFMHFHRDEGSATKCWRHPVT